jgi:hypothetical protein
MMGLLGSFKCFTAHFCVRTVGSFTWWSVSLHRRFGLVGFALTIECRRRSGTSRLLSLGSGLSSV